MVAGKRKNAINPQVATCIWQELLAYFLYGWNLMMAFSIYMLSCNLCICIIMKNILLQFTTWTIHLVWMVIFCFHSHLKFFEKIFIACWCAGYIVWNLLQCTLDFDFSLSLFLNYRQNFLPYLYPGFFLCFSWIHQLIWYSIIFILPVCKDFIQLSLQIKNLKILVLFYYLD